MQQALAQARKAYVREEVPIGAVLVDGDGSIIARAYNQVEKQDTQAAHAELLAINKAGKAKSDWRLNDCWLYVTLEPCSMCMNLVYLSRIKGIVFAAASPLFGYRLDNNQSDQVYKKITIEVIEGICADESAYLLKCFFNKRREK